MLGLVSGLVTVLVLVSVLATAMVLGMVLGMALVMVLLLCWEKEQGVVGRSYWKNGGKGKKKSRGLEEIECEKKGGGKGEKDQTSRKMRITGT